jgi:hypothetical protein
MAEAKGLENRVTGRRDLMKRKSKVKGERGGSPGWAGALGVW